MSPILVPDQPEYRIQPGATAQLTFRMQTANASTAVDVPTVYRGLVVQLLQGNRLITRWSKEPAPRFRQLQVSADIADGPRNVLTLPLNQEDSERLSGGSLYINFIAVPWDDSTAPDAEGVRQPSPKQCIGLALTPVVLPPGVPLAAEPKPVEPDNPDYYAG